MRHSAYFAQFVAQVTQLAELEWMVSRFVIMKENISFTKRKGWGVCANYRDGTLTVCRYGKTPQEAKDKVVNRVNEYYGRQG